jgi:Flp pilus assembly protein TadG
LGSDGWCSIKYNSQRGQAALELALQIPLLLVILAGGVQFARVFYTYQTLQKAWRGGAALLAHSSGVNYCDAGDATIAASKNLMIYGNLQGSGMEIARGLANIPIQVVPERQAPNSTAVNTCPCGTRDADDCDVSAGGRPPDFVAVNLGAGYPIQLTFAYVSLAPLNLKVSVRLPVTGG